MKSQKLERNGKTFWFFPDITISEITRGFLIDQDNAVLIHVEKLWKQYTKTSEDSEQCFSAFLYGAVDSQQVHDIIYQTYQSIPASEVFVVGRSIPSHSKVVKKKRISTLG
jgi:hypothetical protein